MKKNIRVVLLGEFILFLFTFLFTMFQINGDLSSIYSFIDLPTLILIMLIFIPGLLIMGEWKNFVRSFSVGIKTYSLLELKNILGAVIAAQRLVIFGSLFSMITALIILLGRLDPPSAIGPYLAVSLLSGFYGVVLEFFLFPLRLNAESRMNEEMDFGDE